MVLELLTRAILAQSSSGKISQGSTQVFSKDKAGQMVFNLNQMLHPSTVVKIPTMFMPIRPSLEPFIVVYGKPELK